MKKQLLQTAALFLISGSLCVSYGQTDKKAAEIKKCQTALETAKKNLTKAERTAFIADSLAETGTKMVSEGKTELKQLEAELKALDKTFNADMKPLMKKSNSKDKETAMQARAEMKEIETKYKAERKELDAKIKAVQKKQVTGDTNIQKGKAGKKTSEDAVARAQAAVDAAQAKLDLAQGIEPAATDNGKKKKK